MLQPSKSWSWNDSIPLAYPSSSWLQLSWSPLAYVLPYAIRDATHPYPVRSTLQYSSVILKEASLSARGFCHYLLSTTFRKNNDVKSNLKYKIAPFGWLGSFVLAHRRFYRVIWIDCPRHKRTGRRFVPTTFLDWFTCPRYIFSQRSWSVATLNANLNWGLCWARFQRTSQLPGCWKGSVAPAG